MKMNNLIKKLIIVAIIATLGTSLVACTGTTENKSSETKATQSTLDKDELVIGFDDTFVPMGFKDESGKIVGFDIELSRSSC